MKRTYIGLVHKDAGGDYGVSFPDLPGCVTAGATLEEARETATQAGLPAAPAEETGAWDAAAFVAVMPSPRMACRCSKSSDDWRLRG